MSRYIDAEKIKCTEYMNGDVTVSKDLVEKIPTTNIVEVTRCKYCKFYESYDNPLADFDGRCFARNCETDEYDFCNYGVTKKEYEK